MPILKNTKKNKRSNKTDKPQDSWLKTQWNKVKEQFTPEMYSDSSKTKRDVKTKVNESGMPSRRGN